MKKFMVSGTIINAAGVTQDLLKQHMAYTGRWMKENKILMSALPKDQSGVFSIVAAASQQEVEDFYAGEPFYRAGVQVYRIQEIAVHYLNTEGLQKK